MKMSCMPMYSGSLDRLIMTIFFSPRIAGRLDSGEPIERGVDKTRTRTGGRRLADADWRTDKKIEKYLKKK